VKKHIARRKREGRPLVRIEPDGRIHVTAEDLPEFRARMTPIHDEWAEVLNDIAGTHAFSQAGIALAREHYMPLVENAPDPERDLIWVQGFSPKDPDKFGYMRWKIRTIPDRLATDGPVAQRIGQQWAVLIHTQWEHNFRPRFAAAAEIEKKDVKEPLMADIGRMRNDIIHHHGKATKKNCGRCEVLKWFQPGATILITAKQVSEFMEHVGAITVLGDGRGVPIPGLEDRYNPDYTPEDD
jgi:hypothetical protein